MPRNPSELSCGTYSTSTTCSTIAVEVIRKGFSWSSCGSSCRDKERVCILADSGHVVAIVLEANVARKKLFDWLIGAILTRQCTVVILLPFAEVHLLLAPTTYPIEQDISAENDKGSVRWSLYLCIAARVGSHCPFLDVLGSDTTKQEAQSNKLAS